MGKNRRSHSNTCPNRLPNPRSINYVRPHEALKGKTPSEVAGIKVEGENKWITIIQNASRKSK